MIPGTLPSTQDTATFYLARVHSHILRAMMLWNVAKDFAVSSILTKAGKKGLDLSLFSNSDADQQVEHKRPS